MPCPVHIWLPAMAGLAPIGRVARDRIRAFRSDRATREAEAAPPRELKRWAPIQPHATSESTAHSSD